MTALRWATLALLVLSLVACEATATPTPTPQSPSPQPTATSRLPASVPASPSPTEGVTSSVPPTASPVAADQPFWIPPGDTLATRRFSIGGLTLTLDGTVRSVPVGEPLLAIDASTFFIATLDAQTGKSMTWRADLDDGNAVPIFSGGTAVDADVERGRLLIATDAGPRIVVTDFDGQPIASATASGAPQAVFLRDGSVCFTSGGSLTVWQPDTDTKTSAVLASDLLDSNLTAVGDFVVADAEDGPGVLVDPGTGTEIGGRWHQGYDAAISVNRAGTLFAVGAEDQSKIQPTLQLRDAQTGQVVDEVVGDELSYIESVAWLTDRILLVLRTTTGTGVEPMPELRRADQLDRVSYIEPVAPWMRIVSRQGSLLMVDGYGGQVLTLEASESTSE